MYSYDTQIVTKQSMASLKSFSSTRCAVILADDSGSMKAMENGERIQDLEAMLARIAGINEKPLKIHVLIELCNSSLFCNRQSFFTGSVSP